MRFEVKKSQNRMCHQWTFSGLEDLLQHVEHGAVNTKAFANDCFSVSGSAEFTGTDSLAEAVSLCRGGYHASFNDFLSMQQELKGHLPTTAFRRAAERSVHGFAPNIPAMLHGSPKAMYRLAAQEEIKFLRLYFNCAYPSTETHNQIIWRGVYTMALIELLEQLGYRIDLSFFALIHGRDELESVYISVNLKDSGDALDQMSCYFPMCHPSYLRRLLFRVIETTPGLSRRWEYNYGRAAEAPDVAAFLDLNPQEAILIGTPTDMGVHPAGFVDGANRFLENLRVGEYVRADSGAFIAPERGGIKAFE